jgi:hypothetical protein
VQDASYRGHGACILHPFDDLAEGRTQLGVLV